MVLLVYVVTVLSVVLAVRRPALLQAAIVLVIMRLSVGAEQFFLHKEASYTSPTLQASISEFIADTDWRDDQQYGKTKERRLCREYRLAYIYKYYLCAERLFAAAGIGHNLFSLLAVGPQPYLSIPHDAWLFNKKELLWFNEDGQIISLVKERLDIAR